MVSEEFAVKWLMSESLIISSTKKPEARMKND